MRFRDRSHAGRLLANQLLPYRGRQDVVVLGLPRGGVVVASEIADALEAPLDVFVVRKMGVPGDEGVAWGAVASGGAVVLREPLVQRVQAAHPGAVERILEREQREVGRRERVYRDGEPARTLARHIVLLVDDGMATGATMEAAVAAVRRLAPGWLTVAVPVAPHAVSARLQRQVDELICLTEPPDLQWEGDPYDWFEPVDDSEVQALLHSAQARQSA